MIISKKPPSILTTCVGVLFVLLLSACQPDDQTGNKSSAGKNKPSQHRVEVVLVRDEPVSVKQTVSGTLEAITRIRLYNEESGRIISLPYHEGDRVERGTLLVQMDNELIETELAKARASRAQAEVDLERLKKLLPKQISTEEEVARARTELDLAIAEQNHQQIRLQRSSIKAPIDGIITERHFEPGDKLAEHSHIHTIIDPNGIRLRADLSERLLPMVSEDQAVTVNIDAIGNRGFDAHISRIHPTVDSSTHKGTIEIELAELAPDATYNVRVGQFARAELLLETSGRKVIPAHAIHYEPEGSYVYRVISDDDGNTVVEKAAFEQGLQFGDQVEVLSQLETGDMIVSRGHLGLRPGKKVTVTNLIVTNLEEQAADQAQDQQARDMTTQD